MSFMQRTGLHDAAWRTFFLTWLAVAAVCVVLACVFSQEAHHPDEHFQTIAFAQYKLGELPAEAMPWEIAAHSRQWIQPFIYYHFIRAGRILGMTDSYQLLTAMRLLGGLMTIIAVALLMLSTYRSIADEKLRRFTVRVMALIWYIPYIAARTSSEAFSMIFLTAAFAVFLVMNDDVPQTISAASASIIGILLGFAFIFRYQTAFAIVPFVLYVLIAPRSSTRRRIVPAALIAGGIICITGLGSLIDWWGYGHFYFIPWEYFNQQILHNVVNNFRTYPFYAYFYLLSAHPVFPVSLLLTVFAVAAWLRHPMHLFTWITLGFFIGHSMVGHKELRFFFPVALVAIYAIPLALSAKNGRIPRFFAALWNARNRVPMRIVYAVNIVALIVVSFMILKPEFVVMRLLYRPLANGERVYYSSSSPYEGPGNLSYQFYQPGNASFISIKPDALRSVLSTNGTGFLYLTTGTQLSAAETAAFPVAQLIHRSFPLWVDRFNFFNWMSRTRMWLLYRIPPKS
ncbi:MAG: hypothetical protein HZC28_04920 [Spirochaetes bacterium]|nr:hypothetical protein [Spirochaetota bacterium]